MSKYWLYILSNLNEFDTNHPFSLSIDRCGIQAWNVVLIIFYSFAFVLMLTVMEDSIELYITILKIFWLVINYTNG